MLINCKHSILSNCQFPPAFFYVFNSWVSMKCEERRWDEFLYHMFLRLTVWCRLLVAAGSNVYCFTAGWPVFFRGLVSAFWISATVSSCFIYKKLLHNTRFSMPRLFLLLFTCPIWACGMLVDIFCSDGGAGKCQGHDQKQYLTALFTDGKQYDYISDLCSVIPDLAP